MNTDNRSRTPSKPICGACGSHGVGHVCDLPLYIRGGEIADSLWHCRDCGTCIRASDYAKIADLGHFDVASYTNPASEEQLRRDRRDFLRYIVSLTSHSRKRSLRGASVLDVGCSYGHLLEAFRDAGATGCGVEIVENLRRRITDGGYDAYRSLEEIPPARTFDIITMLDVLYYFEKPGDALRRTRELLAPDGILVLRIANRTPLINILRLLGRPITDQQIGDAKHIFSVRGIRRLLEDCGFRIEKTLLREKGKHHRGFLTRLGYDLSLVLSVITRQKLTPGLILLVRPASPPSG